MVPPAILEEGVLVRAVRSVRRSTAAAVALVLPLAALSSCGTDENSAEALLDKVSVSGEVGDPPVVDIDGQIEPEGWASEVVVEGSGDVIEEGDVAMLHAWVGNGYTAREAFSTYDYVADQYAPDLVRISTDQPSANELQALQQSALAALVDAESGALPESVVDSLIGVRGGSRVAIVADPDSVFGGQGMANIGIGNADPVVIVIDVLAKAADGPSGTEVPPVEGVPTITETDGVVTGFDFTNAAQPTDELQVYPVIEGDGPVVEEGATLIANYLGQVFGGEAPFDESYSGGVPRDFVVGGENAQVIDGWNQALVGLKEGSRVILAIPPALGYGETGNEQAGITGTDTLYFVVDVLGSVVVRIPAPEEEPTTEDPAATDPAATDPAAEDPAASDPAAEASPTE